MVYADRKPSPKIQEVRYLFSDFKIKPSKNSVFIKNNSLFTNLKEYQCEVFLYRDGIEVYCGKFVDNLNPQESKEIPLEIPIVKEVGEYIIEVRILLKEDKLYAPKGHIVNFGQYIYSIKEENSLKEINKFKNKMELISGDCNFGVKGKGFHHIFSRAYGGLISIKYHGKEYLEDIVKPNFWRAPTDNDRGNKMEKECAQWKIASLYADTNSVVAKKQSGIVEITYNYTLPTSPSSSCSVKYQVNPLGEIEVVMSYKGVKGLSKIPLFGMNFKLKRRIKEVRYYGLGPKENYLDRLHGAKLGIFSSNISNELSGYVIPQECGNHTKTRWLEICDEKLGDGIKISAKDTFEFSCLPYTPHELENAKHIYELPNSYCTSLNINLKQMGVGGDDSWGAKPQREFDIDSKRDLIFNFKINSKGMLN